ncbi:MAG: alpha/beta fold hydrolase [Flavobacteriaceae bacterium]
MKLYLKFLKIYLNSLSYVFPKYGGKVAVRIFQKVRIKKIKRREQPFYEKAIKFNVKRETGEDLQCYEFGNPNGKLVFLVHGWNSNAGSLLQFVNALILNNYRIISLDLPGHALTKESNSNLYICKKSLQNLIEFIKPKDSFNIIGHSFGSAVLAYALSGTNYKVDNIVLLSANNKITEIFRDFQKLLGFNNRIFEQIEHWTKRIIKEDLSKMILSDKINNINFKKILIIHDKFDKVIPFHNATEIAGAIPNATLEAYEKIGHYRMLWNDDVVKKTITFIEK